MEVDVIQHEPADEIVPALVRALASLDTHDVQVALALAELGDIELPNDTGTPEDAEIISPLAAFYLAFELEKAGLLRTAEAITGLFAAGAITIPLGTTAQLLRNFWQERRNRLTEAERTELYERVFEAPYFDRLFGAVARDIARHADNVEHLDWREAVSLEQSARQLIGFLTMRAGGMTAFAARDIVSAISEAIRFLRDGTLQRSFGVTNLWGLVKAASTDNSMSSSRLQQHVDRGKSGQVILTWLAEATRRGEWRLDPANSDYRTVIAAAQNWIGANFATATVGAWREDVSSAAVA